MTLLTIEEAAEFLRLKKRTLYRRQDIPRVRYGHSIRFIREDLEAWIRAHSDPVDTTRPTGYHRNPLFVLPTSKAAG